MERRCCLLFFVYEYFRNISFTLLRLERPKPTGSLGARKGFAGTSVVRTTVSAKLSNSLKSLKDTHTNMFSIFIFMSIVWTIDLLNILVVRVAYSYTILLAQTNASIYVRLFDPTPLCRVWDIFLPLKVCLLKIIGQSLVQFSLQWYQTSHTFSSVYYLAAKVHLVAMISIWRICEILPEL